MAYCHVFVRCCILFMIHISKGALANSTLQVILKFQYTYNPHPTVGCVCQRTFIFAYYKKLRLYLKFELMYAFPHTMWKRKRTCIYITLLAIFSIKSKNSNKLYLLGSDFEVNSKYSPTAGITNGVVP